MPVKDDNEELTDPTEQWRKTVGNLYDIVKDRPSTIFAEGGFLPVEPEMVLRILTESSLTVTGYLHIMDTDSVRHIVKHHGSQKELLRGQTALQSDTAR